MTLNIPQDFLGQFLFVEMALLLFIILIQPIILRQHYEKEITKLRADVKRLKRELEEATARAEKYEEDFQRELTRVSILLNRVL